MPKNKKQAKPTNTFFAFFHRLALLLFSFAKSHPYITAFTASIVYLLVFQSNFVNSGDTWAEMYFEYVHGAVVGGPATFFEPGIAGYYNLLPKLLVYPFILTGLPVEWLPNFLRISVIIFTVASVSFLAHKTNRFLIKNDWLRIILSVLILFSFYHITSFSFINVWYVGFFPIILISLNPSPIRSQLFLTLYVLFAIAVCISKPSIIILPLVLYWAWRHREYLAGTMITLAIIFQTLLFFSSSYYASSQLINTEHVSLVHKLLDSAAFPGLVLLKFLQIPANNILILGAAGVILVVVLYIIARYRSIVVALAFGLLTALAAYTALFPPDTPPASILYNSGYIDAYFDMMKLQRELLLTILIITAIGICLDILLTNKKIGKKFAYSIVAVVLVVITVLSFRTIDTQASGLSVNLDSFQSTLNNRDAVCMPIAPTPSWHPYNNKDAVYGWYYESRPIGSCAKTNYGININYNQTGKAIGKRLDISIASPDKNIPHISSVLIGVNVPDPTTKRVFLLANNTSGKTYETTLDPKTNGEKMHFIAFNLTDEPSQSIYSYTLSEKDVPNSTTSIGTFVNGENLVWSYFITRVPLQKYL